MASKLLNVRLDEERLRKARILRARGITLSALLREAIDARFEADARQTDQAHAIVAKIHETYPDEPNLGPRRYDVHDRASARRAIQRLLRRRLRSRVSDNVAHA